MKKFFLSGVTGLVLLSFTGCDLVDKVDDVTFEATLPVEFLVNEGTVSTDPVSYAETAVLRATDDPQVEKYKNKIREIRLDAISYKIEDVAAPEAVTFNDGAIRLATGKTLATATSVPVENTSETPLTTVDKDGFNAFAKDIQDDKEVNIVLNGTFSRAPVAFKLTVYFQVTVTADALK